MTKPIIGAGGGGGGGNQQPVIQQTVVVQPAPRTPSRASDNLASKSFANILDLISEGEIEGFPSARAYTRDSTTYNTALLKDVYLNNTAVLRAGADPTSPQASDYNFTGVTVNPRYGTQAQTYIPGFDAVEDERSVNTKVLQAVPITRTVTDTNVNALRVTITIPRLERYTDEGDIVGESVSLNIQVQYNGGGFVTLLSDTISGRTADQYQRDYIVNVSGAFPIDLRVVRTSADAPDSNTQNDLYWTSYTELVYQKLTYANSALVGLRFDAEQFSSVPTRTYRVRGIKVRLPNNATVDQATGRVTYSGVWSGSFGAAQWCSDPAWILYDLLLARYGFGDHIQASQLDKFAFYSASQYCNELVDDGFGGTEPRFSCNCLIQNQDEAYKLVNDLCSVMRCQPYWSVGSLTVAQDKPTDSSYLFTRANVLEPGFSYSGSSLKTRHTVAVVSYLDLTTRELNYEVVEDQAGIAKYGVVTTEVKAFACTSRGQAHRLGEWILYTEQQETDIVAFTASLEAGVLVRPGAVIDIQDPVRAGTRYGGRISAATTTTVTVDNADGLPTSNATVSVILPDGSVATKNVIGRTGNILTLDGSSPFTTPPNANSIWIIQTSSLQTSQWRVLTVAEKEDNLYDITAISYNSSKYAHVERGVQLQTRPTSTLNPVPDAPSNVSATEQFYEANGKALVKIILSWQSVPGITQYRVLWRPTNGNWSDATVARPDFEILDTTNTTYEIQVVSLNYVGRPSQPANFTYAAIGKTAVPGQVQNLTCEPISANSARLRWDQSTEIDVRVGGKVYIKHTNLTDGSGTWSNSVDLIPAVPGSATEAIIPLVEGEVLVKFADDGGRQSTNETSIIIDLPDTLAPLTLINRREDQDAPPFQGTRTNVFYSDEFDALTLDGSNLLDDVVDVDALVTFDVMGDVQPSGTYEFATTVDFGNTFSVDFSRYFVTRGYLPSNLIDSRLEDIDTWADWDGGVIDAVNATLELRSTTDNPSSSPTWGSWQPFVNGTFRGRGFQFRTTLSSSDVSQNILIDELGYLATLQRRTQQSNAAISGSSGTAVTFPNAFFTGTASIGGLNAYLPSVGITAQNMQAGDYFQVSAVSATGFTVSFYNSSGSTITRQFTWSATGYGRAG